MEKKDLLKVYTIAKTLWRNFKLPDSSTEFGKFEANMHDEVWFELLKNYPYKLVEIAMIEYSKKSEFCNIGKIVDECEKIIEAKNGLKGIITEETVFNEISQAITRLLTEDEYLQIGDYIKPNQDYIIKFNSLSDIAKSVVITWQGLKDLGKIDMETFNTVVKSNIMRVARILIQKKKYVKVYDNAKMLNGEELKLLEND